MKKMLFVLLLLLAACSAHHEGQIVNSGTRHIEINGKEYKFIKVVPADNADGVWLLIPKDATLKLPEPTSYSYTTHSGKTTVRHHVACLWIK